jgi:hypothetical protein
MDNQAPKKEHLMKSGIATVYIEAYRLNLQDIGVQWLILSSPAAAFALATMTLRFTAKTDNIQ